MDNISRMTENYYLLILVEPERTLSKPKVTYPHHVDAAGYSKDEHYYRIDERWNFISVLIAETKWIVM